MTKFAIHTLGCKTNQLESASIITDLTNHGMNQVAFKEIADIYIINSCTVTANSDSEALYLARKAKNINPESKVILTGCFAQVAKDEIVNFAEIDIIMGNTEKLKILEYIKNNSDKVNVADIMQQKEFVNYTYSNSGKTRASIKVQDGCNNRCSYCIIPYARGQSRSDSIENIVEHANILVENNYKELVLTGIHLGQWGTDLGKSQNLLMLLEALENIPKLQRYRLTSLDPIEFNDNLINFIKNSKKVCNHFHISLQSANNNVLKRMNRKYTVDDYVKTVKNLANIPHSSIGNDVIVGFPGETDEDFEDTYNNLLQLPITYLHVFPYSQRKATPAAIMDNQVDEKIKKNRASRLKVLSSEKYNQYISSLIDTEQEMIVEIKRDKQTGFLKGVTRNYVTVLIDSEKNLYNEVVQVKINNFRDNKVYGKII
jgi:threonylcarbamoyladenosine tRNA methylthiotransferase MtaB